MTTAQAERINVDQEQSKSVYLEFPEKVNPEEIAKLLEQAGLKVSAARTMMPMDGGFAVTAGRVRSTWNFEKSENDKEWDDLQPDTRRRFAERICNHFDALMSDTMMTQDFEREEDDLQEEPDLTQVKGPNAVLHWQNEQVPVNTRLVMILTIENARNVTAWNELLEEFLEMVPDLQKLTNRKPKTRRKEINGVKITETMLIQGWMSSENALVGSMTVEADGSPPEGQLTGTMQFGINTDDPEQGVRIINWLQEHAERE